MAIVTSPTTIAGNISVENDVELVRASLLYADEIELISIGAVAMAGMVQLAEKDGNFITLLGSLDDETVRQFNGGELPPNWRDSLSVLSTLANTSFFEDMGVDTTELREPLAEFRRITEETLAQSGFEDLLPAIDSGILKISASGLSESGDLDTMFLRWLDLLEKLLQDNRTRVILDDHVGNLARSMVDEGLIEVGKLTLRHANEAATGSGLIARLPAFPQAPIDELLDLRKDLAGPLTRYRAAVSRLSEKLTSRSFDPEAQSEIDDLFMNEVAPAITEIKEGFAEHGLVREITRAIGADLKTVISTGTGAFIFVGMDYFTSVSNWISSAIAIAGPAGQAVATATDKRRAARQRLKQSELFYLYEVNRALQ